MHAHGRQKCGQQQEFLFLGAGLAKNFGCEIAEYLFGCKFVEQFRSQRPRFGTFHKEHHAGDPPLRLIVQKPDHPVGQLQIFMAPHDLSRFIFCQADIFPPQPSDTIVCNHSRIGRWGSASAQHQDVDPIRCDRQSEVHDVVESCAGGNFLIIVHHDGKRRLQPFVKFFKKSAGKHRNAHEVFGGQQGQGLAKSRGGPFSGKPKIIEERGEVCITVIYMVP